jgi:hypothetical protein
MYLGDLDCGGHREPDLRQAGLDAAELAIALQAFTPRGGKLVLRSSKPKNATGAGKYVWRMIVFAIPKGHNHHCLPATADWDVRQEDIPADFEGAIDRAWVAKQVERAVAAETPADWTEYFERRWPRERRKRYLNHLDHIADKVIATVPVRKQAGTMAWARALDTV